MLDNKLSISAEFFQIETKDLIARNISLISSTAIDATAPLVNLGDIKNTGVDLSLGYSDATTSGLTYDVSFNLSHYKNEVVSLLNDAPVFGSTGTRNGEINPSEVEDVIVGAASQIGEQGGNLARLAVILSNLPTSAAGTTISRACSSV